MKPRYIEGLLRHLLQEHMAANPQDGIADVQTFAEAGYTEKPLGLKITAQDGSAVFVQFVGTAPPGGSRPDEPHYYMAPSVTG